MSDLGYSITDLAPSRAVQASLHTQLASSPPTLSYSPSDPASQLNIATYDDAQRSPQAPPFTSATSVCFFQWNENPAYFPAFDVEEQVDRTDQLQSGAGSSRIYARSEVSGMVPFVRPLFTLDKHFDFGSRERPHMQMFSLFVDRFQNEDPELSSRTKKTANLWNAPISTLQTVSSRLRTP